MKPILTNCFGNLEYDEDEVDFTFKCSICGKESEDEDSLDICDNCGNYFCPEHAITKEHQGFNEVFCSDDCKKDAVG